MTEPIITVERFAYCPWGTFGRMFVVGQAGALWTVECPWLDNKRFVSCIPPGTYSAHSEVSHPRFGWVVRLENVPGRDGILIHKGNVPSNFSGCIGVGTVPQHVVGGQWGVGDSAGAFNTMYDLIGSGTRTFPVLVTNAEVPHRWGPGFGELKL